MEKTNKFRKNLNSLIYYVACTELSTRKTKHQAVICLMRGLTNIIYKILKEDREYQIPTELLNTSINSLRERKKLEEEKLKKNQALKEKRKNEKSLLTSTS